jgi:hypothetical protein
MPATNLRSHRPLTIGMSYAKEGTAMVDNSTKSCNATWGAILALALGFFPLALAGQSVTLAWDPSTSPDVIGYVVYYGTDGTNFDSQMDAGPNTSATVTDLQPGTTNYFAVVAYNVNDVESPPSNLVLYNVPAATPPVTIQTNSSPTTTSNSVPPVTVLFMSNINFTLLVSGHGTLSPKPAATSFTNWLSNGIVAATTPSYTFLVESNAVLQANFISNPFLPVMGLYHGLFYVSSDPAEESSGSIVADVTSDGFYTANIRFGAYSYSFSGVFSLAGAALKSIPRAGLSPITVRLQLGSTSGPMTGTISDGNWTANLEADPAIYSSAHHAPEAGKYTLLIPGSDNASAQPGGNGFGAVTVNDSGLVSFSGSLGDGTAVTSSSTVSGQGQWPFYISLYGGKGSILGWLSFADNGDMGGQINWFKLPQKAATLYPGGFTNNSEAVGSFYKYTNGSPVLGFTDGLLSLINGDLTHSITDPIGLGQEIQATSQSETKLTYTTSSGLFSGNVLNPETGKLISVKGAVLQNQNLGAGYFLGTNESGSVVISPPQ